MCCAPSPRWPGNARPPNRFYHPKPLTPLQKAELEVEDAVNAIVRRSRSPSPLRGARFEHDVLGKLPPRASANDPPYDRIISQMVSARLRDDLDSSERRALEMEKRIASTEQELVRVHEHYADKDAKARRKQQLDAALARFDVPRPSWPEAPAVDDGAAFSFQDVVR